MSRSIPDPGFRDDDGTAEPAVTAALSAYDSGSGAYVDALAALQVGRLLVPVVAVSGQGGGELEVDPEVDPAASSHEKTSDMAAVLLTRPDGRVGLLAFTSAAALAAWNSAARPVPVATPTAARAALQEQAGALVVDVAGPVRFAIEGDDLLRLAEGWRLMRVGERVAWIRPASE
ncbi:MAG: SseB family protein [Nocardioides sp.]